MEEKTILQQRFSSSFSESAVIGREGSLDPQRAKEVFQNYQIAIKRYDEITDKLNLVMSKTYVEVDNRKISVASAIESIRKGGQLLYSQFGMGALPFNTSDDLDLYFHINSRVASQIQTCSTIWHDDEDEFSGTKILDPNELMEKKEFYKNFNTDYLIRLKTAVQKAVVLTDVQ
jgi:hypothetical protein